MFLGDAGPYPPPSRRRFDPGRLHRRRGSQCDLPQPRRPRRGHRDHFDPAKTSYRRLLEFFFQIHDPTTRNRQGNDADASYRSAIFFTDDEQKRVALDTIADVEASGLWPGKVVTELAPAGPFWEAEPEHQDYLERSPRLYLPLPPAELGVAEALCRCGIRPAWRLCMIWARRRRSADPFFYRPSRGLSLAVASVTRDQYGW